MKGLFIKDMRLLISQIVFSTFTLSTISYDQYDNFVIG